MCKRIASRLKGKTIKIRYEQSLANNMYLFLPVTKNLPNLSRKNLISSLHVSHNQWKKNYFIIFQINFHINLHPLGPLQITFFMLETYMCKHTSHIFYYTHLFSKRVSLLANPSLFDRTYIGSFYHFDIDELMCPEWNSSYFSFLHHHHHHHQCNKSFHLYLSKIHISLSAQIQCPVHYIGHFLVDYNITHMCHIYLYKSRNLS